jgi:hypothetical protein
MGQLGRREWTAEGDATFGTRYAVYGPAGVVEALTLRQDGTVTLAWHSPRPLWDMDAQPHTGCRYLETGCYTDLDVPPAPLATIAQTCLHLGRVEELWRLLESVYRYLPNSGGFDDDLDDDLDNTAA